MPLLYSYHLWECIPPKRNKTRLNIWFILMHVLKQPDSCECPQMSVSSSGECWYQWGLSTSGGLHFLPNNCFLCCCRRPSRWSALFWAALNCSRNWVTTSSFFTIACFTLYKQENHYWVNFFQILVYFQATSLMFKLIKGAMKIEPNINVLGTTHHVNFIHIKTCTCMCYFL